MFEMDVVILSFCFIKKLKRFHFYFYFETVLRV